MTGLTPYRARYHISGKGSQWTLSRFLYFFSRYLSLTEVVMLNLAYFYPFSPRFCLIYLWYQCFTASLQIWALWSILTLRLHAMYGSKNLLRLTLFLFLLSATAMATLSVELVIGTPITNEPFPGFLFCSAKISPASSPTPNIAWYYWLPILLFESYLFLLALLLLIRHIRYMKKGTLVFATPKYLFEVILRDSVWYFALVVGIDLGTMIIWKATTFGTVTSASQWTNGLLIPFFPIVSSRMSFDLLEVKRRRGRPGGATYMTEVSTSSGVRPENQSTAVFASRRWESEAEITTLENQIV